MRMSARNSLLNTQTTKTLKSNSGKEIVIFNDLVPRITMRL